jgi:hypothetical protein
MLKNLATVGKPIIWRFDPKGLDVVLASTTNIYFIDVRQIYARKIKMCQKFLFAYDFSKG